MSATQKLNENINVVISNNTLDVFAKYRQIKSDHNESCGILIGTHSVDGKRITITCVTEPDEVDVRNKFSFRLRSVKHGDILNKRFQCSGKQEVYLGTWHSHPEIVPTPSYCDISDWMKQFKKNNHIFDMMVFTIVGTSTTLYWIVLKGKLYQLDETNIILSN